jgi:hypothetical protein
MKKGRSVNINISTKLHKEGKEWEHKVNLLEKPIVAQTLKNTPTVH